MKKLLSLVKDSHIKVSSRIGEFLSPAKVYLPIDETAKMLIKNKKVKKNDLLYELNKKKYYSPISGQIEKIINIDNQNYLQIKNDYQEIDSYVGIEGSTTIISPTVNKKIKKYIDFASLKNKKTIHLIGFEDELYLANKTFLFMNHKDEILLMIDTISSVYNINDIKLYVKEQERESIELLNKVLDTYPNIELVILPDLYPLENPVVLKKYLKLTEDDIIFDVFAIYKYYYEIIKERQIDTIYVTITGDEVDSPMVVNVKIGTPLKEVITELFTINEPYELYLNSLLKGNKTTIDKVILTEDIKGVYFMNPQKRKVLPCISCGKCNEVCPLKLNPYNKVLKGKKIDGCISCGLCTFICPSNIKIEKR